MNMETQKNQTDESGSFETILLVGENVENSNTPLKVDEELIDRIISMLPTTANQERRFISVLGANPNILTKNACRRIACVNLSHLRSVTVSLLEGFGLEARCVHPPKPIKNEFGENTGQVLWGLYQKDVTAKTILSGVNAHAKK